MKKHYKFIVGIVIGLILSGVVGYAATVISSANVSYNNSNSGLKSNTLQGAIDELYEKTDIRNYNKVVSAYSYNSSTCITGEESTCVKTNCVNSGSCKAGDIIKFKVNDTDIITFHVMYDNGSTLTMQSQKNIIRNTDWISESDYIKAGGTDYGEHGKNDKGPITLLLALEKATANWVNVNTLSYTLGSTSLSNKGIYTDCDNSANCSSNAYTLTRTSVKARLMTMQEAYDLGCRTSKKSCPIWMYNYCSVSTNNGGTKNEDTLTTTVTGAGYQNNGYFLSSAGTQASGISNRTSYARAVYYGGAFDNTYVNNVVYGARAVVSINK